MGTFANNVDPDQMLQSAQFHQGLQWIEPNHGQTGLNLAKNLL